MDYLLLNRQIRARREIARAIVNVGPQMPACFSCCRRISLNSRRITAAVLAVASVAFVACSDDNDNPVGTANNNTTVRFVNATTGGTNLDIAQNGTVGAGNGNVTFGSASSCTRVNNSNPQLAVRTAGTTTSLTGFSPSFAANGTYTVLVTGTAASPVFTTLNDEFVTPTGANAAVRIINATSSATAGAGSWDIYVNPPTSGSLPTPNAAAIGRTFASSYLTVPSGQANIIRLTNAGSGGTLQNISVPSLAAGQVTTIVVTDAATGVAGLRTFTLAACT
jgi:hypothetical protein